RREEARRVPGGTPASSLAAEGHRPKSLLCADALLLPSSHVAPRRRRCLGKAHIERAQRGEAGIVICKNKIMRERPAQAGQSGKVFYTCSQSLNDSLAWPDGTLVSVAVDS